jgi:hypothetical protein
MNTYIALIALLLVTVNTTVINPLTGSNPYCDGGKQNWQFTQLTSAASTLLDFDAISAF